jgi:tetratricopeptide (TPR) repeat protein
MTDSPIDAIVAALQSNDAERAERLCRQRLQHEPDAADALVLLALSLWRLGQRDASLEIYARLTRLYPDEQLHWRNYATALRNAGNLAAAEEASTTAVRLAPDDAELLELHGLLQVDLGKRLEARDTLLRAFGKAPGSPSIRIHAALACAACRDLRADNLLRPWREWLPLDDYLQSQLAEAHLRQGDVDVAVELLEDLMSRLPEDRAVRLRLASLSERVNRLDAAEALLDSVVASGDGSGTDSREVCEIAHQRAQLAERRRDYTGALAWLEAAGPRSDHDCAHWFELARLHDKRADPASAMAALGKAHALQVGEIKAVHPHWFEPGAQPLLIQNERVPADDYAQWPVLQSPDASQSPVFVVGFPRSGTTLLEQMLDAHPRLQSMDERPFFNHLATLLNNTTGFDIPRDLGRLNQRDCDELRKGYLTLACSKVPRRWDARLVDKNPMNMLWLPMIHRLFPEAKFIFALRHPCDVLLSNYMQNFMATSLGAACENLETLATAYVESMRQWLYHLDLFKPDVFISRYEELIEDPAAQTRRIAAFLELEDAEAMLHYDQRAREKGYIATPSYTQVIEPINRKGIGRWQRYREYFEPVLPILQPMLDHWGYATETRAAATEH